MFLILFVFNIVLLQDMCEILDSAMRVNPPELQSQLKFILERLKSTGDDHKDGKIGKKSCKNIFLFCFLFFLKVK